MLDDRIPSCDYPAGSLLAPAGNGIVIARPEQRRGPPMAGMKVRRLIKRFENVPKARAGASAILSLAIHLRKQLTQCRGVSVGEGSKLGAQTALAHHADLLGANVGLASGADNLKPRAPCRAQDRR